MNGKNKDSINIKCIPIILVIQIISYLKTLNDCLSVIGTCKYFYICLTNQIEFYKTIYTFYGKEHRYLIDLLIRKHSEYLRSTNRNTTIQVKLPNPTDDSFLLSFLSFYSDTNYYSPLNFVIRQLDARTQLTRNIVSFNSFKSPKKYQSSMEKRLVDKFYKNKRFKSYKFTSICKYPLENKLIIGGYELDDPGKPFLSIYNPVSDYLTLDLVDIDHYTFLKTDLKNNICKIQSISCENDMVCYSTSYDNQIPLLKLYDQDCEFTTMKRIEIECSPNAIKSIRKVKLSPDATRLSVSGVDGQLKIYDVETQKILFQVKQPVMPIHDHSFDNNELLFSGEILKNGNSYYRSTGFWKLFDIRESNKVLSCAEGYELYGITRNPMNHNLIATVMRRSLANVYDRRTMKKITLFQPTTDASRTIDLHQQFKECIKDSIKWMYGNYLASSEGSIINIWDSQNGKSVAALKPTNESDNKYSQFDISDSGLYLYSNQGFIWSCEDLTKLSISSFLNKPKTR
ncbi:hypothetical protein DLAC_10080 [Tieghemostelium lacteum]|uniref:WD40 repeat-containing protein n=1 Tax=Tieghemostelium lacteum TaxID=361077 RepID=A0A151Z660_TIELA|nr:hypothetical protein DLAC_10080 [Tieghemostelium lacteum]|eukprot:KYQ89418.1 hypothetical protein DLAC_10080 [Tieghemostelium lacteum]